MTTAKLREEYASLQFAKPDSSVGGYNEIVNKWLESKQEEFDEFIEFLKTDEYKDYRLQRLHPTNPNEYIEYDLNSSELTGVPNWHDLDPECQRCIFTQIKKYRAFIDEASGTAVGNRFTVDCQGIPRQYISDETLRYIGLHRDDPQAQQMLAVRDPVTFAKMYCCLEPGIPIDPRPFQNVMLRCSSKRAVFRCGRRIGKSIALAIYALFIAITQPFFSRDQDGNLKRDPQGRPMRQRSGILIITPRQSQADNIMKPIIEFIRNNEFLAESIAGNITKTPYYKVTFKNGSTITCITSATGTGTEGLSIRSFSADVLIMDEANYLGAESLKAAMAILMTNEHCVLRASSTPIGLQDFFWNWCNSSPTYREFHYPTPVLQHWHRIKKSVYSDVQTMNDFLHEYMAEFSASEMGVFRLDLVSKAKRDYKYEMMEPNNDHFIYSIGIDWNSNAGTEIVVTGFNKLDRVYLPVEAVNVPKSEYTQVHAIQTFIDLVKKWSPQFVYVDEGHGGTQIEIIKLYALHHANEHPAIAALQESLKPYNFSTKIEVADPITGAVVKKDSKPFLVKNAVRRFEEENIWISAHDRLLEAQLTNYIIASVTELGREKYKPSKPSIGDHRLDAFMLSLIAFKLELSNMNRRHMAVTDTAYIGSDTSNNLMRSTFDSIRSRDNGMQRMGRNEMAVSPSAEPQVVYGSVPSRGMQFGSTGIRANGPGFKSTPVHSRSGRRRRPVFQEGREK